MLWSSSARGGKTEQSGTGVPDEIIRQVRDDHEGISKAPNGCRLQAECDFQVLNQMIFDPLCSELRQSSR